MPRPTHSSSLSAGTTLSREFIGRETISITNKQELKEAQEKVLSGGESAMAPRTHSLHLQIKSLCQVSLSLLASLKLKALGTNAVVKEQGPEACGRPL